MTIKEAHMIVENLQRIFTQFRFLFSDKLVEANGMSILALEKQMEQQKKGKKLINIITEYPVPGGHPYFSIRYEENGEIFEGFGTYKPEVLAEYIREYFMGGGKRHVGAR